MKGWNLHKSHISKKGVERSSNQNSPGKDIFFHVGISTNPGPSDVDVKSVRFRGLVTSGFDLKK